MKTSTHELKPHHIILFCNYLTKEERGEGGEDYIRSTINEVERHPQYEELNRRDYDERWIERGLRISDCTKI